MWKGVFLGPFLFKDKVSVTQDEDQAVNSKCGQAVWVKTVECGVALALRQDGLHWNPRRLALCPVLSPCLSFSFSYYSLLRWFPVFNGKIYARHLEQHSPQTSVPICNQIHWCVPLEWLYPVLCGHGCLGHWMEKFYSFKECSCYSNCLFKSINQILRAENLLATMAVTSAGTSVSGVPAVSSALC